jgi:hypothetical protein
MRSSTSATSPGERNRSEKGLGMNSTEGRERPDARRFWRHAGGLGVIGVVLALALGDAFMSIGSDQRAREGSDCRGGAVCGASAGGEGS